MKIGIDASRYRYGEATGVEWYSWHIINCLINELKGGHPEDELILYSREPIEVLGKVNNRILATKRFWTLNALTREIKKNPPDVLFVPSHILPLSLPKRSVITIHDTAFRHLKSAYSFSQYHYLNWSTKYAVKHADKIIVPSQATSKDLQHFYKCPEDKITVIHHGFEKPKVDREDVGNADAIEAGNSMIFEYFGITKSLPYILFIGRLESKKNLARLVEAFAKFAQKFPDYKLILAGKRGVGFEKILKKVDELELMHKVIMPGYITEEEKVALYQHCKIFAFVSLYEGFGLPILEAFHYERPVICSNVSCMPEIAGKAAHFVDPYDVDKIAQALEILADDEKYRLQLTSLGKERLKLFSWKTAARETLKVLKNQ